MTDALNLPFEAVTVVDFEFTAHPGEQPVPICMVAQDVVSGRTVRLFEEELQRRDAPPYRCDRLALVVAYYASAEAGCHLALKWPIPANILDLYTEFRCVTNGLQLPLGVGLGGALMWHGLDGTAAAEKADMRELACRGGPYSGAERAALLDYCASDVEATAKLLKVMRPKVDLPRALLRGRYMGAAAHIERTGVPIDTKTLHTLQDHWTPIQRYLITAVDAAYHVFDNTSFRASAWRSWVEGRSIPWPRTDHGALRIDADTFRDMARTYPEVAPMQQLRATLGQLRLSDLAVGKDARNRCLLSAYQARTGRNQPSSTRFIFGPPVWIRNLIQPPPGYGLAYLDWSQQEFGIAAALSGDVAMLAAYTSGDPYLAFAIQAGLVPTGATKASHGEKRDIAKAAALAVQYGMGAPSLARWLRISTYEAADLLRLHRRAFPRFWAWSDAAVNYALLSRQIHTAFGWTLHVSSPANECSLLNFPMQANGAEMLRLACCAATDCGVRICAPVHDALLIEAPLLHLQDAVAAAAGAMAQASDWVLGGFRLRSDVRIIQFPARYSDPRGERMWKVISDALVAGGSGPDGAHLCNTNVA